MREARATVFADRKLLAQAAFALVRANVRYWTSVAPLTREELTRWRVRAERIEAHELRTLALGTLSREGFAAEVAATLATLAPKANRDVVTRAIVALEVMFDYLDGLTERPTREPVESGRRLFGALADALDPDAVLAEDYFGHEQADDGGYLRELATAVKGELAQLPSAGALAEIMLAAAARCSEAEVLMHAEMLGGGSLVETWARREAGSSQLQLQWREYLAGAASSVLSIHALIALASEEHASVRDAVAIDDVYLALGVLSTMLDSVVDYEHDRANGTIAFIKHYASTTEIGARLVEIVQQAATGARDAPDAAHHLMTIAGVAAYFTSAPTASTTMALPVTSPVQNELRPLITPTLTVMRFWRAAKRLRSHPRVAAWTAAKA